MDYNKAALALHKKHKGKIAVSLKVPIKTKDDLSTVYTPGVAQVCRQIHENTKDVYTYTSKANTLAVLSDGSAVLGLGNIGPEAAIPVMEGKAAIFKQMANIDAFPICIQTQDKDEIVEFVRNISPTFGAINLEDIAAPKCFEIEEKLQDLGIPVMHDDQHGTAVVVLAALINACKVTGKKLSNLTVVVNGAGAAGVAITKLLLCHGIDPKICESLKDVIMCDSKGIIYQGRSNLNPIKEKIAKITNKNKRKGTLQDALVGVDVFIGVSKGNLLTADHVKTMNPDPIILAMANPTPEIMPDVAKKAGASVVGTGRSDFANQINNSLAFPGIFRGALDAKAVKITDEMKIAAANAIASCVKPTKSNILPNTLDKSVVPAVAKAVARIAKKQGVVRK